MKETERDPRPDLAEDHLLWVAVLITAKRLDRHPGKLRSLFGLLHGLRCGGARLQRIDNPKVKLKLDYTPLLEAGWDKDELLNWLEPMKKQIIAVFNKAA